jgi:mobilization protein NikA
MEIKIREKESPRTKTIMLRVNEDEHATITQKAKERNIPTAHFVRCIALDEEPPKAISAEAYGYLDQLNEIASKIHLFSLQADSPVLKQHSQDLQELAYNLQEEVFL